MDFQYVMAASDSLLCSSDSPARNSSGCASGFHSRPPSDARSVAAQSRRACSSCAWLAGALRHRARARAVAVRPGFQQRVRGGQHHLLQVGGRQVGPHRGLHAGVHLHGAHRADRVDGDQAGLGQVVDGRAHHVLVGRVGGARPSGDVAAGGRAGQHGAGHAVVIEHRGQHQRRARPARSAAVRARTPRQWTRWPAPRPRRPARRACDRSARPAARGTPGSPACGRSSPPWPGPARAAARRGPRPGPAPRSAGRDSRRAGR